MAHCGVIGALLVVPMLKEGALVGAIEIYRQEVRPFTGKLIWKCDGLADVFSCYAIDLPGTGESPAPRQFCYTLEATRLLHA